MTKLIKLIVVLYTLTDRARVVGRWCRKIMSLDLLAKNMATLRSMNFISNQKNLNVKYDWFLKIKVAICCMHVLWYYPTNLEVIPWPVKNYSIISISFLIARWFKILKLPWAFHSLLPIPHPSPTPLLIHHHYCTDVFIS